MSTNFNPGDFDQLLCALAQLTPADPQQRWQWPSINKWITLIDFGSMTRANIHNVLYRFRQDILDRGYLREYEVNGQLAKDISSQKTNIKLYTWKPPMVGLVTTQHIFLRGGILEWLMKNTPSTEWWSFSKRSPLGIAMATDGIKYNSAYATMQRAHANGLADFNKDLKAWRWTRATSEDAEGLPNKHIQALCHDFKKLSGTEKSSFLARIGVQSPGIFRDGAYELHIEKFDSKSIPQTISAILFYHGGRVGQYTAELYQSDDKAEYARVELANLSRKQGLFAEPSPEELKMAHDNEQEHQLLNSLNELYPE